MHPGPSRPRQRMARVRAVQGLTNAGILERRFERADEWIRFRTGYANEVGRADHETDAADGRCRRAAGAIRTAGSSRTLVGLILLGTLTPGPTDASTAPRQGSDRQTRRLPPSSPRRRAHGFVYAFATAQAYIVAGMAKHVIVIGAASCSPASSNIRTGAPAPVRRRRGRRILSASDEPGGASGRDADTSAGRVHDLAAGGARKPVVRRRDDMTRRAIHTDGGQGEEIVRKLKQEGWISLLPLPQTECYHPTSPSTSFSAHSISSLRWPLLFPPSTLTSFHPDPPRSPSAPPHLHPPIFSFTHSPPSLSRGPFACRPPFSSPSTPL